MALKLNKEFFGVVMAPKKKEVYPGGGVLYPRVIELHYAGEENGTLLATFDHSTLKEPPVSPIYESTDGGKTWSHRSDMADTKNLAHLREHGRRKNVVAPFRHGRHQKRLGHPLSARPL